MRDNKFLSFPFEIKSIDQSGMIEGYASTFGNIDQGYDIVEKGAFKKTLRETKSKFPILADHDPRQQIGWNMEAVEDEKGLFVKGQLDIENNAKAREKFSLLNMALKLKAKPGLSIGYMTIKAEPDREFPNVRRLKELKLFEYSLVTFPMNEMAIATGAKDVSTWGVAEKMNQFIEILKRDGYSTDEINKSLQMHLNPVVQAAKEADAATSDPDANQMVQVIQSIEAIIKNWK